jgi:hypothetical protein
MYRCSQVEDKITIMILWDVNFEEEADYQKAKEI